MYLFVIFQNKNPRQLTKKALPGMVQNVPEYLDKNDYSEFALDTEPDLFCMNLSLFPTSSGGGLRRS